MAVGIVREHLGMPGQGEVRVVSTLFETQDLVVCSEGISVG